MKNYPIVEIKWLDIAESSNQWQSLTKLEKFITNRKGCIVRQVGFLFEEAEDQIAILSSYFPDDDLYGTCNVIPKGCILEMKILSHQKEPLLLTQNS